MVGYGYRDIKGFEPKKVKIGFTYKPMYPPGVLLR